MIGLLIATGLAWLLAPSLRSLGRLPGDVVLERDGGRLYLPLTSGLLIALAIMGALWLVRALLW